MDARGYWQTAVTLLETIQSYDSPSNETAMRYKEGIFAMRLSEIEIAQAHFEEALSLLQKSPADEEFDLWEARICEAMAQLAMQRDNQEAMEWTTRGLAVANRLPAETVAEEKGNLLIRRATILGRLGQIAEARATIERGLELLPPRPSAARISGLMTLGVINNLQGEIEQARLCWEKGVEVAEALGDFRGRATLWRNLSILAEETGDIPGCLHYNEQALRLYERIGDQAGTGHVSSNLGFVYLLLGEMDAADTYLQRATDIALTHKMPDLELFADVNRTRWHIYRRQYSQATELLEKSQMINQELKLAHTQAEALRLQAMIAAHERDYERAIDLIEQSITLAKDNERHIEVGRSWRIKGTIQSQMGDYELAFEALKRSAEIFGERNSFELARTQVALSNLYIKQDRHTAAKLLLEEARNVFVELDTKHWVAKVDAAETN